MLACDRRLWHERHASGPRPPRDDHGRVLRERSIALEREILARFAGHAGPLSTHGVPHDEAARETRRLLQPGGPALARPLFVSDDGRRSATPAFVHWEADALVVAEIRLALRPQGRRDLALQMAHHVALIEETTGHRVARCEVWNGRGESFDVEPEPRPRYEAAVARALELCEHATEPATLQGHSFCQDCQFYSGCWDGAEAERRVEVLPELSRPGSAWLRERGIRTFDALAALEPAALQGSPVEREAVRLLAQARAHALGAPVWLAPLRLPTDRTLAWLDVEGDAMGESSDVPIFLWGVALEPSSGDPVPEAHLADLDAGGDARGWDRFVSRAETILAAHPDVAWVHWDESEPLWIGRYVRRLGAPATLEKHWRERAAFVDLHAAIARSVRLPLRSYSVKWVARLAGFAWRNPEAGSEWAVARFHRARHSEDPAERQALLAEIAEYNADDLLAMRAVWRWLESRIP